MQKKNKNITRNELPSQNNLKMTYYTQARIQRGGAVGVRPPLFVPNSLKSPLNWPKNLGSEPSKPLRPLLFQILDPPLTLVPGVI